MHLAFLIVGIVGGLLFGAVIDRFVDGILKRIFRKKQPPRALVLITTVLSLVGGVLAGLYVTGIAEDVTDLVLGKIMLLVGIGVVAFVIFLAVGSKLDNTKPSSP